MSTKNGPAQVDVTASAIGVGSFADAVARGPEYGPEGAQPTLETPQRGQRPTLEIPLRTTLRHRQYDPKLAAPEPADPLADRLETVERRASDTASAVSRQASRINGSEALTEAIAASLAETTRRLELLGEGVKAIERRLDGHRERIDGVAAQWEHLLDCVNDEAVEMKGRIVSLSEVLADDVDDLYVEIDKVREEAKRHAEVWNANACAFSRHADARIAVLAEPLSRGFLGRLSWLFLGR